MTPGKRNTGADLARALEGTVPPDEDFERSIADALALLTPYDPQALLDRLEGSASTAVTTDQIMRTTRE